MTHDYIMPARGEESVKCARCNRITTRLQIRAGLALPCDSAPPPPPVDDGPRKPTRKLIADRPARPSNNRC